MKKLIEFLAKNIVDKQEDVSVQEEEGEMGKIVKLSVASEDMGKIIGKNGRIIKALRNLLRIRAIKNGQKVYLELSEKK